MVSAAGSESESSNSFRSSLPPILLLTLLFFLNFVSRVLFAPLLPEIEGDLGLDHAASGSFFLFISSGYFISILLSGVVSGRLGDKNTIILSTIGCGVTLIIIGQCESLVAIRSALFLLGYAAGLYLQSGLATIFQMVAPSHLARGMAVHELAPNCGFVMAPLLCTFMLQFLDWQEGLQTWGAIMIAVALVYSLRGPDGKRREAGLNREAVRRIILLPEFWCVVLLFSFAICSTLGMYAMLPLYLVAEHDMASESANTLVSLSRISSVFMPLVGGWMGDRFGNGKVMLSVLLIAGFLTVPFGLLSGHLLLLFIVLQPMVAVSFFPSGFAVLSRIGGKETAGNAVSLCIPIAFLTGGGLIPAAIGAVGDYFTLALGFCVTGVFMIIAAVLASGNRFVISG